MKKPIAVVVLIGVLWFMVMDIVEFCHPVDAQPLRPVPAPAVKYWQDSIPRPNQQWVTDYGRTDADQVAYCINALLRTSRNQANINVQFKNRIVALTARIEQLEDHHNGNDSKESKESGTNDNRPKEGIGKVQDPEQEGPGDNSEAPDGSGQDGES